MVGLRDGELARVGGPTGRVTVTVEVTDDIRRGVVALPHGFGHDLPGVEQAVATATPSVHVNGLVPGDVLDPLSGTAALNAIPVTVAPAGEGRRPPSAHATAGHQREENRR